MCEILVPSEFSHFCEDADMAFQLCTVVGAHSAPPYQPIKKTTLRKFELKFRRPTNSESRCESCCENGVFSCLGRECNSESCSENARVALRVAPRMAFSLRGRFFLIGVVLRLLIKELQMNEAHSGELWLLLLLFTSICPKTITITAPHVWTIKF